jgi:phage gp29-like protein
MANKEAEGTAMPPQKGAPVAYPPIHTGPEQKSVAPWPINDRWPNVIGQAINFSYLSSVFRLSTTGYRQQLVDLLNELLEMDAHLFSVMQKRILSTANGRVDIKPFELDEDDPEYEKSIEIADLVRAEIGRIPNLTQCLATLLWGLYYAVTAAEIFWTRDDEGWHPVRLEFVHSRRLAYPDAGSWDLYVWDQGMVYGWMSPWGSTPSNSGVYGTRIADWPGKFIVFTPGLRGDYPTREGLGRQTAPWSLFKRIGARGGSEYLERFAKPFMDVSWATFDEQGDGTRVPIRAATDDDIELAKQVGQAVGPGSGSGWAHPDSIKLEPKTVDGSNSAKLTWHEWIQICNAEISKAVVGGNLGTDAGKGSGGNRALGEVQERAEADLEQFDGNVLGETIKRDLISWIVRLNRPDCMHLLPSCTVHVEMDPDPKFLIECAKELTGIGAPVDVDALAEDVGIRLTPNESGKPRRSYMSDVLEPDLVDPNLMSEEAKQAEQDDKDAQNEIAKAKASQPAVVAPGAGGAANGNATQAKKTKKGPANAKEKAKAKQLTVTILLSDRPD